jgi:dephospho-CoA kinase
MKILCVVGMPASGKTVVSDKAKQLGVFTLTTGEIIREEIQIQGIDYTENNERRIAKWFYDNERELMRRIVNKITQAGNPDPIVIEGFRSPSQINSLKDRLHGEEISLLAVHSSPQVRWQRERKRRRYNGKGYRNVKERDKMEIEMGVSQLIALANHVLINEGDLTDFRKTVKDKLIDILNIDVKR